MKEWGEGTREREWSVEVAVDADEMVVENIQGYIEDDEL